MAGVYLPELKLQKGVPMTVHIWPSGKFHAVVDDVLTCMGTAIEIPPHGRLGDLDALWEKEKSEHALKKYRPKNQSIIFDAGFLAGFRAAAQIASKMPTIIPADPEGGTDG